MNTSADRLPLILSPSLGCPLILSVGEIKDGAVIPVIVAARGEFSGEWSISPSLSNRDEGLKDVSLGMRGMEEICQAPSTPSSVDGTRESISRELLNALGEGVRIFRVGLTLSEPKTDPPVLLRKVRGFFRPTLYDLCLSSGGVQRKLHAVCLVESKDKELRFIHLTDLHLSRRNDLIGEEVSAVCKPPEGFNNFNDRMRDFIEAANMKADAGLLDLVLIGGDLVDFVNHGVSDKVIEDDNNWQVFIEILTGMCGKRKSDKKAAQGISVPVFTTTGNHDWRLHPYDTEIVHKPFGLSKQEARCFDFEYYDTNEALELKKEETFNKIMREGTLISKSKENLLHSVLRMLLKKVSDWKADKLLPLITVIASFIVNYHNLNKTVIMLTLLAAAAEYVVITKYVFSKALRYLMSRAIIPIEAGVHALHYYFMHINPYFNYAFSYGKNYFIVMDTGPDCLVGQYFWDEGRKKMVRMSIKDNLLGGSPDSMAFYPVNEYYTYGQIDWFEKTLANIDSEGGVNKRIFVLLHAPPVSVQKPPDISTDKSEILLEENARYGTVNHYLSQFFHLCLGKKEDCDGYKGPLVDIVFSGHAHQKIEFRLDVDVYGLLLYSGPYSSHHKSNLFDEKRPYVVQTAACGPLSDSYPSPPYCRIVHVDRDGAVLGFDHERARDLTD